MSDEGLEDVSKEFLTEGWRLSRQNNAALKKELDQVKAALNQAHYDQWIAEGALETCKAMLRAAVGEATWEVYRQFVLDGMPPEDAMEAARLV